MRRELSGTDLFYIESAKKRSEKPISQSLDSVHTHRQQHPHLQPKNVDEISSDDHHHPPKQAGAPKKRTDSAPNLELSAEKLGKFAKSARCAC